MKRLSILIGCVLLLTFFGCTDRSTRKRSIVVYSPHPIALVDPILADFEELTGIIVDFVPDNMGELVSRMSYEQQIGASTADIFWGGTITGFYNRENLFDSYTSPHDSELIFPNTTGYITHFAALTPVMIVNTELVDPGSVTGYNDLLTPQFFNAIALPSPLSSAPAYEQLINQLWAMGLGNPQDGWTYVEQLLKQVNGNLFPASEDVVQGVVDGRFSVGFTSESIAYEYQQSGYPIEIIYPREGVILRPYGIAIGKNTPKREEAELFINFLLSPEVQKSLSSELYQRSTLSSIDTNLEDTPLRPLHTMTILEDDILWATEERDNLVEQFFQLYQKQSGSRW